MTVDLIVRSRGTEPRRIPVPPEGLTIGRIAGSDVVVPDITMSRHHARLVWKDGVLHLEDVASTSGIQLGRQRSENGPVPVPCHFELGQNDFELVER